MPTPPTLLDVRWRLGGPPGIDLYRAGHIPGAVFTDLDRDLAAPPGPGGRHPMPATADFEAAMRRAGVRDSQPVVVYDDADSTAAARAWWLLRYFGHRQVRVLDGGFAAWTAAGHPVETGLPASAPAAGDFTASPGHLALLDADGAAALARTGVLLDARAGARYRGETEPVDPVAGHIPGAVSAPTAENVTRRRDLPPARRPRPPLRRARRGRRRRPPSARTAAPASPPPTRSWPSPSRASPRPSTPAPGPNGSPTPPAHRHRPGPGLTLSRPLCSCFLLPRRQKTGTNLQTAMGSHVIPATASAFRDLADPGLAVWPTAPIDSHLWATPPMGSFLAA